MASWGQSCVGDRIAAVKIIRFYQPVGVYGCLAECQASSNPVTLRIGSHPGAGAQWWLLHRWRGYCTLSIGGESGQGWEVGKGDFGQGMDEGIREVKSGENEALDI